MFADFCHIRLSNVMQHNRYAILLFDFQREGISIKTLVELFDYAQIENVIAALRLQPEKVVFVGFKEIMTNKKINAMEQFLQLRHSPFHPAFQTVERYDLDAIVATLNTIIDQHDDCVFDLTGGKELVLVAMGIVSASRNIPMVQFNVRTGDMIKVKNCDSIHDNEKVALTIKESVALNGGAVIENTDDFCWQLTEDFKADIEKMWRICKDDCSRWNQQTKRISGLEQYKQTPEALTVCIDFQQAEQAILPDEAFFRALAKQKLIFDYELRNDRLQFRYKNEQIRRCIVKSGNILELYAYTAAYEIAQHDPGYYDDIKVGVLVDWDGVLYDKEADIRETRNEIDLILMRDMTPVFISCKNGEVHKDALYELNAVAERYGGKYAKKVLLATYISSGGASRKYLLQRAKDMNIQVIADIDQMKRNEFIAVLKKRTR